MNYSGYQQQGHCGICGLFKAYPGQAVSYSGPICPGHAQEELVQRQQAHRYSSSTPDYVIRIERKLDEILSLIQKKLP